MDMDVADLTPGGDLILAVDTVKREDTMGVMEVVVEMATLMALAVAVAEEMAVAVAVAEEMAVPGMPETTTDLEMDARAMITTVRFLARDLRGNVGISFRKSKKSRER
jgi:hypothetical protein